MPHGPTDTCCRTWITHHITQRVNREQQTFLRGEDDQSDMERTDGTTAMPTIPTVSKIMIIRHAEKPPANNDPAGVLLDGTHNPEALIVQGWQRAGALAALFDPTRLLHSSDLAVPQTIIAAWTSDKKGSQRPEETITPLALKLGLTTKTFPKSAISTAVGAALAATGTVLIGWQHGEIPTLATTIATLTGLTVNPTPPSSWPPPKWPGTRFDLVWVFDLVTSSQGSSWTFTQVPQLLLAGDLPTPIT